MTGEQEHVNGARYNPCPETPAMIAEALRGYAELVYYNATRAALLKAADALDKEPKP